MRIDALKYTDEKEENLVLEPEFLGQSAVCALVGPFEILQVLAAVGNEAEQPATGTFVFPILIQMSAQLLDAARQNSDLDLR